jgi:hypothetical protein
VRLASLALSCSILALAAEARGAEPLPSLPQEWQEWQEWIGVEVSFLSYNEGTAPDGRAPSRMVPGMGATLRLLRHKWALAYVTPIQTGLFLGGLGDDSILVHAGVEGGLVLRDGVKALELGLGAGAGILSVHYANTCDGSCNLGGAGALLSPVVRFLYLGRPGLSAGGVLRAVIPLQVPDGDWFGHYTGRAVTLLAGIDVAFGPRR